VSVAGEPKQLHVLTQSSSQDTLSAFKSAAANAGQGTAPSKTGGGVVNGKVSGSSSSTGSSSSPTSSSGGSGGSYGSGGSSSNVATSAVASVGYVVAVAFVAAAGLM
jgi:hypothetical protein